MINIFDNYRKYSKDLKGNPCSEEWNYRSIVGMMLYLVGISRPDIAYAAHQCAIFFHNTKRSYEAGLEHIARYLKGTRKKYFTMKPYMENLRLDLFTDADFAGL